MGGDEIRYLKPAQKGPEDAHHQSGDANLLYPCGRFPGSKEKADEKKSDKNHSDRTAGNEERKKFRHGNGLIKVKHSSSEFLVAKLHMEGVKMQSRILLTSRQIPTTSQ